MRAVGAGAVFLFWCVVFIGTVCAGLALAVLGISFMSDLSRRKTPARDFSPISIVDAELAIKALEKSAPSSTQPAARIPPPPLESVCPRYLSEFAVPRVLSSLGFETRDPHALMARASRLGAAGFDVFVTRAALPQGVVERALATSSDSASPPKIVPVRSSGGVVGVCVEGIGVLPIGAGILRGDVITSINGVPIVRPDLALEAYESAWREGMAVIELLRGERRVIVGVLFPKVTRGALGPVGALP